MEANHTCHILQRPWHPSPTEREKPTRRSYLLMPTMLGDDAVLLKLPDVGCFPTHSTHFHSDEEWEITPDGR